MLFQSWTHCRRRAKGWTCVYTSRWWRSAERCAAPLAGIFDLHITKGETCKHRYCECVVCIIIITVINDNNATIGASGVVANALRGGWGCMRFIILSPFAFLFVFFSFLEKKNRNYMNVLLCSRYAHNRVIYDR